ncbi:MAG: M15 family metallopeptidase [Oscillospiraceae bacterium]|nr:M15 family metallopeptidase [Oscillospiraceae bacterium]
MNRKLLCAVNITLCLIFVLALSITAALSSDFDESAGTVSQSAAEDLNHDWAFFLINNKNPLPEDYEPELMVIEFPDDESDFGRGNFELDARCVGYANEMLKAAKLDGVRLSVVSAYRSRQRQDETFRSYVDRLMRENYSQSEAVIYTASQIALPGASEHNAGLALDILSEDWFLYNNDVTDSFDQTPEFKWLEKNSWKYGFILRYPKGMEEITGFIYEPWHFRFVGIDRAEQIYNSGFTLEEYIERYPLSP